MAVSAEDMDKYLDKLADHIAASVKEIEMAGLNRSIGPYKNRIFVDGQATDNSLITSKKIAKKPRVGAYSSGHGKKRRANRKKVDKVNLDFDSTLRKSIDVGESDGVSVVGFKNDKMRILAGWHEEYRKLDIFAFSDEEISLMIDGSAEEMSRVIENFKG